MGISRNSGPVYGAKSLLKVLGPALGTQNTSTAAAFVNSSWQIPAYEDWFITEVGLSVSTCAASGQNFLLKSEGGSTTVQARTNYNSTVAQTISTFSNPGGNSTTIAWTVNTVTPSPGEFEGLYVPAGSTVRLVSSCASAPSLLTLNVYGYIRYIDSTRAV